VSDGRDHLFDAFHFTFRNLNMNGGDTYFLNEPFVPPRMEDATLTMPLDQFEDIRAGLGPDDDFDPESYVINMEEGSDGIWRAESVTMKVILNHQA